MLYMLIHSGYVGHQLSQLNILANSFPVGPGSSSPPDNAVNHHLSVYTGEEFCYCGLLHAVLIFKIDLCYDMWIKYNEDRIEMGGGK